MASRVEDWEETDRTIKDLVLKNLNQSNRPYPIAQRQHVLIDNHSRFIISKSYAWLGGTSHATVYVSNAPSSNTLGESSGASPIFWACALRIVLGKQKNHIN